MNINDSIKALEATYITAMAKAKEALDWVNTNKNTGYLRNQIQKEYDRIQEDLNFFSQEKSRLILEGTERKIVAEAELKKVASKMTKSELIQVTAAQELDIWNLQQILSFVTKRKKTDNKARLQNKAATYQSRQNINTGRNEKFSANEALLKTVLDDVLKGLGRKPISSDFRTFKIRAEKIQPAFIPKPRESEDEKRLSAENRAINLDSKIRKSWNDGTLRNFWEKHTHLKPSSKKPSTLK